MKHKLTRILSVLLCAALVFCLLPHGTAYAAGSSRRTPIQPMEGMPRQSKSITSEDGVYSFTTFADLKELAAQDYSSETVAYYAGEGPLVISESLEIPTYLILAAEDIQVLAGVELVCAYLYADNLTVDGILHTAYAEVYKSLTVNGAYYNYYQLRLYGSTAVSGEYNIAYMDSECCTVVWYEIYETSDLKAMEAAAYANGSDWWIYVADFSWQDVRITEDVTLPWNCEVYISGVDVVVAHGYTLTVECYVWVEGSLIISGSLLMNGYLDIYYYDGGLLEVYGDCRGAGIIYTDSNAPEDAVIGFNGYDAEYDYMGYWILTLNGQSGSELPRLAAPTDLEWGYDYEQNKAVPGAVSWKSGDSAGTAFEVAVYLDGSLYNTYRYSNCDKQAGDRCTLGLFETDLASGRYYFTVTALDTCGTHLNSEPVTSGDWNYTKPDKAMDAATNLSMDLDGMYWTNPEDMSLAAGYEICVLYHEMRDEDMFPMDYITVNELCEAWAYPIEWPGYYSFSIRILSGDITQACNGEWVQLSEAIYCDANTAGGVAGMPLNPGWGYDYDFSQSLPGAISWQNGLPDSGEYLIVVFKDNQWYDQYGWSFAPETTNEWHSIDTFCNSDPETGEYYFAVNDTGNGDTITEGPVAISERWYYVKPDVSLGDCTNLTMDAEYLYWDIPEDTTYVDGYEVQMYYSETGEGWEEVSRFWTRYPEADLNNTDWYTDGDGYYCFSVRLLSSDIQQVCNGQWSALSEPYQVGGDSGNGDNNTGDDDPGNEDLLPFNEYEWEVLKIVNKERMAEGLEPLTMYELIQLAADIRTEEIKELFSHTRPDGTDCFTVFDEVGLSYWSAGENIAMGYWDPEDVMNGWMNSPGHRANILTASFAHIGIGFDDYSWVQLFTDGDGYRSMELLGETSYTVEAGTSIEELDLVAVLQSSRYGTCYLPVDESFCSGYDPNQPGTQTVRISALGVSTAVEITVAGEEPGPAVGMEGDFDGNGTVDDADVAYLLWHTLFADTYPIDINGDLNGDGAVDDADVAYLLWHTLFPDAYPL